MPPPAGSPAAGSAEAAQPAGSPSPPPGAPTAGLVEGLRKLDSYRGQITHVEHIASRPAREATLSTPLPEPLGSYLAQRDLRLWSHQVATIEAVRGGDDVILTTATASGKTLAFNLAVLERLHTDPQATALYLYPMKALANDQLGTLSDIEAATGIRIGAAVYDGDTPKGRRSRIRAASRLVVTNPFGLHEYLPSHHLWERFLSKLALVVVDEAHWYRGVLGSNVALVLRRLRRVASHYGAAPSFVLASGTIANPAEHAANLVGRPHLVVDTDGAPQGPKDFVVWDSAVNPARSPHLQVADLLAHFATTGHQAICFTVSRRMAELVARWAAQAAPGRRIAAYRAGYLPGDRRQIEAELRSRALDAVAATSALELGIDVGELDAVVMAGYPGSICSTWQQAGRAGRSLAPSIAVLAAFEDPLDQYLVSHPEELFARPHENAVVDLANPHILAGHLTCAAAELPLRDTDEEYFGPQLAPLVASLTGEGVLAPTPMGHAFHGTFRPAGVVRLNAVDEHPVEVRCGDEVLEVISGPRALASAHRGAILLHRGASWRIESLDPEAGVARAVAEETESYTETLTHTTVEVLGERRQRPLGGATLCLGELRISQQSYAYRLKSGEQVLGTFPLELAPAEMDTVGAWLALPPELASGVRAGAYAGGLHAGEHALIHMMPLLAMCDRRDVGGLSSAHHAGVGAAAIFVYDGYKGGVGIAEKAFERFEHLAEVTLGLLEGCRCESGCPSCVYDRNCGSDNQPMDRLAAATILRGVLRRPGSHAGARR
ncbi:MAG: DEAD/DEAH box helicase [Acidimicrobiales bacterium]